MVFSLNMLSEREGKRRWLCNEHIEFGFKAFDWNGRRNSHQVILQTNERWFYCGFKCACIICRYACVCVCVLRCCRPTKSYIHAALSKQKHLMLHTFLKAFNRNIFQSKLHIHHISACCCCCYLVHCKEKKHNSLEFTNDSCPRLFCRKAFFSLEVQVIT